MTASRKRRTCSRRPCHGSALLGSLILVFARVFVEAPLGTSVRTRLVRLTCVGSLRRKWRHQCNSLTESCISRTLRTEREERTYNDAATTLGRHRRTSAQMNLQLLREISAEHMRAAPRSATAMISTWFICSLPLILYLQKLEAFAQALRLPNHPRLMASFLCLWIFEMTLFGFFGGKKFLRRYLDLNNEHDLNLLCCPHTIQNNRQVLFVIQFRLLW
jgi:hypothetical protein